MKGSGVLLIAGENEAELDGSTILLANKTSPIGLKLSEVSLMVYQGSTKRQKEHKTDMHIGLQ